MQRFSLVLTAVAALVAAAPATAAPRASNASEVAPVKAGKVTLKREQGFSLVGFAWHGRTPDIEVRARGRDGEWTRWAHVPTGTTDGPDRGRARRSAPVWTGPSDRLQYRLHERPRSLRVKFVRVRGKGTAARQTNRVSAAGSGAPPIVPRSSWDPNGQCRPRSAPGYGQVKVAFVHHTVTLNEYSPQAAPGIVLAICRYHRNSNGWNDVGYNFLVDKYGTLYEGRAGGIDRPVIGAQAQGFNAQSTGISNIGNHEDLPQSDAALQAMAALIRWKLPLHGAATEGRVTVTSAGGSSSRYAAGRSVSMERISGHRDGNHTACPGGALYAQLPTLRSMVAGDVGPSTTPDGQITMSADRSSVSYGDLVLLSGSASTAGGPLANAPVSFGLAYGNGRGRAARSPLTTAGDGSFRARIRARYSGSVTAHTGGISSAPLAIEVVADLEAALRSASIRRGRRVVVRGSVRRGSRARTRIVVRQITESGPREVRRRKLAPARRGSFRTRIRIRRPGDYEVAVVAPTNRINRGTVVRLPLHVR
jgi:hypothetical protein